MRREGVRKSRRFVSKALGLLAALSATIGSSAALSGCDWIHYAFMNSIPFRGKSGQNTDIYVYLGVDGLSYHTVQTAMKNGAFEGSDWNLSKFITMFPGTSDASWTRIMHTPKIGGYEIEYYDPNQDQVIDRGFKGLAKHLAPPLTEFLDFEFDYLRAFDFRANGYTSMLNAYADTFASKGDTIDNLFFLLSGRIETSQVFSAYLLEFDVLGHMRTSADVARTLMSLSKRIKQFRAEHPNRRIHFTLFSDHGMDFIHVQNDRFIDFASELPKVGIDVVDHLKNQPSQSKPFAIPIMHTRVTYMALHTLPEFVEEISGRVTSLPSVDLALHRLRTPPTTPQGASHPLDWYAIWADRKMAVYFGFDPETDEYYLPAGQDYARVGFQVSFETDEEFKVMTDDELFEATKMGSYPDLFYRTRTSLTTVSLEYPADVLISFRPTYASLGFKVPGANDIASAGFHGAMEELGTAGVLLSNERSLPDAVRSDTLLELFPRIKDHMHNRGVQTIDGDSNASLHYKFK